MVVEPLNDFHLFGKEPYIGLFWDFLLQKQEMGTLKLQNVSV